MFVDPKIGLTSWHPPLPTPFQDGTHLFKKFTLFRDWGGWQERSVLPSIFQVPTRPRVDSLVTSLPCHETLPFQLQFILAVDFVLPTPEDGT